MSTAAVSRVEVRCPRCGRFVCEVPPGTPVRSYCRSCGLHWEEKV